MLLWMMLMLFNSVRLERLSPLGPDLLSRDDVIYGSVLVRHFHFRSGVALHFWTAAAVASDVCKEGTVQVELW